MRLARFGRVPLDQRPGRRLDPVSPIEPPRNQSSSSTQSYRSMLKPLMQIRSIGTATAASLTSSRRMAVEQLMEHCKDAIQMIETWKDEDENLRCAAAIEDELERSYSASEFSFQDSRTSLSTKSSGSDGTQASANVDSGTGATCHSPTLGAGNPAAPPPSKTSWRGAIRPVNSASKIAGRACRRRAAAATAHNPAPTWTAGPGPCGTRRHWGRERDYRESCRRR